jgi:hypothetical protein
VGDPHFTGDRSHQAIITQYLNPLAFAANAVGTYGALGRNTFIGPGYANLDLGVVKDFAPQERFKAQLRFEMFNSLNHANFALPAASRTSGTFLQITSAGDPRILQLALRFAF